VTPKDGGRIICLMQCIPAAVPYLHVLCDTPIEAHAIADNTTTVRDNRASTRDREDEILPQGEAYKYPHVVSGINREIVKHRSTGSSPLVTHI
jgi:hypothetical protein